MDKMGTGDDDGGQPEATDRPAPLTKIGRANPASVLPGQTDLDVVRFITAWKADNNRESPAARLVYAGILGATAPVDQGPVEHAAWLASCTRLQRHLLALAAERRREQRRATDRAEYAAAKVTAGKGAVRDYVTDLSPEDRAERRRVQNAEAARRLRDKKRTAKIV